MKIDQLNVASVAAFSMVNGYRLSHAKILEADAALSITRHFSFGTTFFLDAYSLGHYLVESCFSSPPACNFTPAQV